MGGGSKEKQEYGRRIGGGWKEDRGRTDEDGEDRKGWRRMEKGREEDTL
jgi:hypothetical protein